MPATQADLRRYGKLNRTHQEIVAVLEKFGQEGATVREIGTARGKVVNNETLVTLHTYLMEDRAAEMKVWKNRETGKWILIEKKPSLEIIEGICDSCGKSNGIVRVIATRMLAGICICDDCRDGNTPDHGAA